MALLLKIRAAAPNAYAELLIYELERLAFAARMNLDLIQRCTRREIDNFDFILLGMESLLAEKAVEVAKSIAWLYDENLYRSGWQSKTGSIPN